MKYEKHDHNSPYVFLNLWLGLFHDSLEQNRGFYASNIVNNLIVYIMVTNMK
jgi:hypothetical protein